MSEREHLTPPGSSPGEPLGVTQFVTSPPGRTVHVSGQVARERERKLVGGSDFGAQARQALASPESRIGIEAKAVVPDRALKGCSTGRRSGGA